MAKGQRAPVPEKTSSRANRPLERVFVDLSGPKPLQSAGGLSYVMILRDDPRRRCCMYFLARKSEAADDALRLAETARKDARVRELRPEHNTGVRDLKHSSNNSRPAVLLLLFATSCRHLLEHGLFCDHCEHP